MPKDNNGLVFIVDISGYSKFVRDISPSEGLPVVRHLLSKIIECNRLSFSISEIEGDAILFYRMGTPPSVEKILQQFAQMRNSFKRILQHYQLKFPRVDQLDLKAIAHYGYMKEFKIKKNHFLSRIKADLGNS